MNITYNLCTLFAVVVYVICAVDDESNSQELMVENWAEQFGKELWHLGQNITKANEIKMRYKKLNETHVFRTNATQLLNNISTAMNRMIRLKMTAVSCLMDAAERLSEEFEWKSSGVENYTYYNAKYSPVEGINDENDTARTPPTVTLGKNSYNLVYKTMKLSKNGHFYGLNVNTSYSTVYLPTILFERLLHVQAPLQWSEKLDEVFEKNYRSDPSLSWQYFGSTAGFMRHYPAIRWSSKPSVFDTRLRPWYIQAATCSKDAVILLDISGSMSGMHQTIAQLVIKTLLRTFNNDDSINIIFFNTAFTYLVPCFENILVQATPENINTFHNAVNMDSRLSPTLTANYSKAFTEAFELLARNRANKCNSCDTAFSETCNQMIMLITDDDPDNALFEVIQKHNRIITDNSTNIPVRVFTYMMGRDITNTPELRRLACENRGSFAHVHSKDEVLESVLKYIAVLARPLVLQAEKHPVTWSHTFMDISDPYVTTALQKTMEFNKQKNDLAAHLNEQKQLPNQHKMDSKYIILNPEAINEEGVYQEYRPMTAISIPIFNKKRDEFNKTRFKGDLLGVAGTDVPIAEFEKLALPYKIGVNGYAFVVTNNGYVLFHPKLRPVEDGILKENYNSVDLTELELLDDNKEEPRQPHSDIVLLRTEIVNHKHGSMENLSIKFHYDNMRRVGSEVRNYHYTALDPKIEGPFTLGLVLPASYGNNWIKAGDEINKSIESDELFDKYFQEKWKIHPRWVYCDYFHSHKWNFKNPEEKLLHFMEKIFSPDWEWREQYPASDFENISMDIFDRSECDRKSININESYCDKELMQLLFFDAKITHALYNSTWVPTSTYEKDYAFQYKVSVRFLATQGGLSRWQHITDLEEGELEFGDIHNRSVEEVWYKRPVLYRNLNPQAFVFSVPFDSGNNEKLKITASHAIFVEDENNEAPGSVVGYEMLHKAFYDRFIAITNTTSKNCTSCLPCTSEHVDCYIIDENGYVVLSEIPSDTGKFFAQTELKSTGVIMETMITKKIFRRIPMFDYQGLCREKEQSNNASSSLLSPFYFMLASIKWILWNLIWLLIEGNFVHVWSLNEANMDESIKVITEKYKNSACDKKADLFMLQHEHLSAEGFDAPPPAGSTISPFFVKRIAHSNLLLVVVKNAESSQSHLSVNPNKVDYNITSATDHSCNKLNINNFCRRKLGGCYNSHPEEPNIKYCSGCYIAKPTIWILLCLRFLFIYIFNRNTFL